MMNKTVIMRAVIMNPKDKCESGIIPTRKQECGAEVQLKADHGRPTIRRDTLLSGK